MDLTSDMDSVTRDLLLAQDGDDSAFARFVVAAEIDVRRFCSWLTRPGFEIDDLVQETFFRAFRSLNTFSGLSPAKSWLMTIARRVCLDMAERRLRQATLISSLSSSASESTRTIGDIGDDIVGVLMIDELAEPYREAFVLVRILGFGYEDAAQILDCPRGTVQSRVARARMELAESIHRRAVSDAS